MFIRCIFFFIHKALNFPLQRESIAWTKNELALYISGVNVSDNLRCSDENKPELHKQTVLCRTIHSQTRGFSFMSGKEFNITLCVPRSSIVTLGEQISKLPGKQHVSIQMILKCRHYLKNTNLASSQSINTVVVLIMHLNK